MKRIKIDSDISIEVKKKPARSFQIFALLSMIFVWSAYTLTVRYTRVSTPKDQLYSSTTVVLLSEMTKLCISTSALAFTFNFDSQATINCLKGEFFGKPIELLKMSVPSLLYAVQNNLDFVALSNLDAGVYQVTSQLKIVTTVIFMVILLGREYSRTR